MQIISCNRQDRDFLGNQGTRGIQRTITRRVTRLAALTQAYQFIDM